MEAVITAAGFHQLEAIHGIIYTKVVGDDDGSVLHTIHTTVSDMSYIRTRLDSRNLRVTTWILLQCHVNNFQH